MKIKKNDQVKIVVGKDSGKQGKVEKVFVKEDRVLVEGVNQYKRHVKSRTPGQKSEIITLTKPLPVTNVALICPKCKKPTRVGYKIIKDGKVRVCKKCQHEFV
ncbi:MAG TPA: 50S ribosomal protein L24 [Methylomirabilota bacterium]|nr:50S ribosomal protein L24 [Methylomirabilota bacterium]